MGERTKKRIRFAFLGVLGFILLWVVILLIYFPGQQKIMAVKLATGFGIAALQSRVDGLENSAILHKKFTADDKQFLSDLYMSLARGANLTIILRQSGKMMEHYLSGNGISLELDERIFIKSKKVQKQINQLKREILKAMSIDNKIEKSFSSPVFYMPDPSSLDSVFGLYYGKLIVEPHVIEGGKLLLKWRAEVPWKWPSYEYLKKKYGTYHAESFPIPNMRTLIGGKKYTLFIDNGLGEYLVKIGLAKSFLAYSEWEEEISKDVHPQHPASKDNPVE